MRQVPGEERNPERANSSWLAVASAPRMMAAKTASVNTAFEIEVPTMIQEGNLTLASRNALT